MSAPWRYLGPHRWSGVAESVRTSLVFFLAATTTWSCAPGTPDAVAPVFDVMEKTISELAAALDSGEVTSRELVELYLARIDATTNRGRR